MDQRDRERLIRFMERQTRMACRSPEDARDYLVKLGTHTPEGQLTPEFGGPGWEEHYGNREEIMSRYSQEQSDRIMHTQHPPERDPFANIDPLLALALATRDPHPMTPQMVARGRAYLSRHHPHFSTDYVPPSLLPAHNAHPDASEP